MGLIALNGMEFFAYHGCHEEEQKTGNRFMVDVEFFTESEDAELTDNLSKTINYQKVYEAVKTEMAIPSSLIEHVTRRIRDALIKKFPSVKDINITVAKLNPPLGGKVERVQFSLHHKA
ncbi:MAG: dihydroneopterin aldolase [Bacteroidota bacterium]